MKSKCCKSEMKVVHGDDDTHFIVCKNCGEECTPWIAPVEKKETKNGQTQYCKPCEYEARFNIKVDSHTCGKSYSPDNEKEVAESWEEKFNKKFILQEDGGEAYYLFRVNEDDSVSIALPQDVKAFITQEIALARADEADKCEAHVELARKEERERIVKLLDWRNRTDKIDFHDGDDVVDWIDKKLETLTNKSDE